MVGRGEPVKLRPVCPTAHRRPFHPLTGSECDEEDVDFEESDSDESWTTESAISSESILSSMCMNGGDEKPFACPVPGCKKRYKVGFHAIPPLLRTCTMDLTACGTVRPRPGSPSRT